MRELSDEEVQQVLVRNGVGVLSLVDGEQPYAIPMSFGYDGDVPIFAVQLGADEHSRKYRCLERNRKAAFTVYEQAADAPGTWRSVVATGELSPVPDDEREAAFGSLAANAEFPTDLTVWGQPIDETELDLFELAVDELGGREFSPATAP